MKNYIKMSLAAIVAATGFSGCVNQEMIETQDNVHTTMNNGEFTSSTSHEITPKDLASTKGKDFELISGVRHVVTQEDIDNMKNRKR